MKLPSPILSRLRPHQHAPAQELLNTLASSTIAVDLSDTGTGKTYVAMAVATSLRLPTLVICPKIATTQWHLAASHFNDAVSVVGYEKLRTGNTPFGRWEHPRPEGKQTRFKCRNCQCFVEEKNPIRCFCTADGSHELEAQPKPHRYGKFSFSPEVGLIIFDEAHRCGGDSLLGDILIGAKPRKVLALSATIGSSPLHFRALGYLLGFHNLNTDLIVRKAVGGDGAWPIVVSPSFRRWAGQYGVRWIPRRGPAWYASAAEQAKVMADIRSQIIPSRGVRMTTESIPDFPGREISVNLYDMGNEAEIESLYAQMIDAMKALESRAAGDADPEHPLTKILRAHQRIELLKVPAAVELAQDEIAKGFSVGLFVNFRQTVDELCKRLQTKCVIHGEQSASTRKFCIDTFQRNASRIIVVNSAAGGICVNLQDMHGNFPRSGLVFPGHSATIFQQLVGRFHRHGGKSTCYYKVMLAANTVETQIYRALSNKLANLSAINDGDLRPV